MSTLIYQLTIGDLYELYFQKTTHLLKLHTLRRKKPSELKTILDGHNYISKKPKHFNELSNIIRDLTELRSKLVHFSYRIILYNIDSQVIHASKIKSKKKLKSLTPVIPKWINYKYKDCKHLKNHFYWSNEKITQYYECNGKRYEGKETSATFFKDVFKQNQNVIFTVHYNNKKLRFKITNQRSDVRHVGNKTKKINDTSLIPYISVLDSNDTVLTKMSYRDLDIQEAYLDNFFYLKQPTKQDKIDVKDVMQIYHDINIVLEITHCVLEDRSEGIADQNLPQYHPKKRIDKMKLTPSLSILGGVGYYERYGWLPLANEPVYNDDHTPFKFSTSCYEKLQENIKQENCFSVIFSNILLKDIFESNVENDVRLTIKEWIHLLLPNNNMAHSYAMDIEDSDYKNVDQIFKTPYLEFENTLTEIPIPFDTASILLKRYVLFKQATILNKNNGIGDTVKQQIINILFPHLLYYKKNERRRHTSKKGTFDQKTD